MSVLQCLLLVIAQSSNSHGKWTAPILRILSWVASTRVHCRSDDVPSMSPRRLEQM